MKTLSKALVATVAAGAVAISSASPAFARDGRSGGGVDAGDVIAGALVIGGIAAVVAASSNNNRNYGYDRAGYGDDNYRNENYRNDDGRRYDGNRGHSYYGHNRGNYGGNPRMAIEQCVRAAERGAGGGRADVTDVRDIRQTRWGYEVRGRIAVNSSGRDWRNGDRRYGNGWNNDYRGWNEGMRGFDSGSFTCKMERGRIVDLDYSGIRGL